MKPGSRKPRVSRVLESLVALSSLSLVACSASYFQSLILTSRVVANATENAKIEVPELADSPVVLTDPTVKFTLTSKSSPVTLTGITRMVFSATTDSSGTGAALQTLQVVSKSGTGTAANLLKQSILLRGEGATVTTSLPSIWSTAFLNTALSDNGRPADADPRAWFVDVTLEGTNDLGQTITANVGIPIVIVKSGAS